jgi:hypothetical protein
MGILGVDEETILGNIAMASLRKTNALAEYKAASAELAWWMQGAELAGITVGHEDEEPNAGELEELFPPSEFFDQTGTQPTLRQAIMAHLRDFPTVHFPLANLTADLVERGWLADDGAAAKRVSDMAGLMAGDKDKQIERAGRGVYRLHPRLAAAFDTSQVSPRITGAGPFLAADGVPAGSQE